ncbi:MAG: iron-sulfur cluster assembly scaffold protein [Pseudomonadota bacterium]
MAENDLIKLYSTRILALASDIPHLGRLDAPDATVRRRAPQCGSSIVVDVGLTDGRVTQFAQEVKACALGQAAASILGREILGLGRHELLLARDGLEKMLKADGPVPAAPFDGFEVLLPARDYANRHGSIMLAVEASLEAIDEALSAACA